MNRATHIIKDVQATNGDTVKLWRETQYRDNSLETTFFVDHRSEGQLVMRQPYKDLNEALSHYYSLISSALTYGQELHRLNG